MRWTGISAVLVLVAGAAAGGCTRSNPEYTGAGGTGMCTPPCRAGEYCVQGIRCVPYDGGVPPADTGGPIGGEDLVGPGTDAPIVGVDQVVGGPDQPGPGMDVPVPPPPPPPPDMVQGMICPPGQDVCVDAFTQGRCNDTGTGFSEQRSCQTNEQCNDQTGMCEGTGGGTCNPGDSHCVSSTSVERCLSDGSGFAAEDCAPNFTCSRTGGTPNCYEARGCNPPGGFGCLDTFLIHCVDGRFLEQIQDCNLVENATCSENGTETCCLSSTGTSLCCDDNGGCFTF
jgi:hypothetical protein